MSERKSKGVQLYSNNLDKAASWYERHAAKSGNGRRVEADPDMNLADEAADRFNVPREDLYTELCVRL